MKKIAIASLIALVATAASALEVGVTAGTNYAKENSKDCGFIIGPMTCTQGADRTEYGVTVGQKFGKLGLTAGVATSNGGTPVTKPTDGVYKDQRQDRFSLVAGYDVAKLGMVTVTPKVGVSYLSNARDPNGYALTLGLGASVPVTKQVAFGVDLARQYGQDRVSQFDGNRFSAGLTYKF